MAQRAQRRAQPAARRSLTVLIPAYNESRRLPDTLQALSRALEQDAFSPFQVTEVIVADDGSTDATSEVARYYGKGLPGFSVHRFPHQGKGGAIKSGWMHVKAEWVLIGDADLVNTWFDAGILAGKAIEQDAPIAIGCRGEEHSTLVVRNVTGRLFNFFTRKILNVGFEDTQCGFKLFRRKTVHPYIEQLTSLGFAWDVELLYLAHRSRTKILSLPVFWEDHPGSKVHLVRDGMKMFLELIRIRMKFRQGKPRP